MTEDGEFVLPLSMKGMNVMMNTCTPTAEEFHDCMHITLSSHHPWDPHHVRFPESSRTAQEEMDEVQRSIGGVGVSHGCQSHHQDDGHNSETLETELFHMDSILRILISSINVSKVEVEVQDVPAARMFESKERHTTVTPEYLSERWSIGLGQARETLKRTTQHIVRSATMPLARRYRADNMYEKQRLRGEWFTDTLDGRVTSQDGNSYGQVFANRK